MPDANRYDPAVALGTAREAAAAGGRLVRERSGDRDKKRSKDYATDFVTEVDVASGVEVVRAILTRDPGANIMCEEPEVYDLVGIEPGTVDDEHVWVIDPIDGTTSFIHGFPCYSVAVALLREGQPLAGAVYNVPLGEMNSAAVGLGAWRDGIELHVTQIETVREALLVTGFPYDRGEPLDRQLAVLAAFLRAPVHGIRRDGSAEVDCCNVASGRTDGFWEYTLKLWDMAAGVAILREAGAEVTDTEGRPWSAASQDICCANPVLHREMLRVIAEASATV